MFVVLVCDFETMQKNMCVYVCTFIPLKSDPDTFHLFSVLVNDVLMYTAFLYLSLSYFCLSLSFV